MKVVKNLTYSFVLCLLLWALILTMSNIKYKGKVNLYKHFKGNIKVPYHGNWNQTSNWVIHMNNSFLNICNTMPDNLTNQIWIINNLLSMTSFAPWHVTLTSIRPLRSVWSQPHKFGTLSWHRLCTFMSHAIFCCTYVENF